MLRAVGGASGSSSSRCVLASSRCTSSSVELRRDPCSALDLRRWTLWVELAPRGDSADGEMVVVVAAIGASLDSGGPRGDASADRRRDLDGRSVEYPERCL